jgi:hypothetical protein
MFAIFLTPAYAPFAIAFVVMIGIGLIEAIGLGLGHLDLHADVHAEVDGGGVLDWLGLGHELPILIWLTSLLGCFTLAGIAIQQGATALAGAPLHWGLASGGALIAGSLLNTLAANGLARIMPGFEGTARRGSSARAKIVDQHGQAHFIMVEPHNDTDTIATGETALIVRRDGKLFYALPEANTLLRSI